MHTLHRVLEAPEQVLRQLVVRAVIAVHEGIGVVAGAGAGGFGRPIRIVPFEPLAPLCGTSVALLCPLELTLHTLELEKLHRV